MPVFDSEFFKGVEDFVARLNEFFEKSIPFIIILTGLLFILVLLQQFVLTFLF